MSTPTDLRRTLAGHAAEVQGLPAVERLAAVHGRVRVVRRRRRTTVAGVGAAAVLAAGAAVWLPGRSTPDPAAERHLGGHTAPRTMTSLGYGYTFADGVEGRGRASLDLTPSSEPRLVSWAGSAGAVRLVDPGLVGSDGSDDRTQDPGSADFSNYSYVDPGRAAHVEVSGAGTVALAVFDLSSPAPGHTEHGVTWRDTVAGAPLVAARTGAPGETALSFTFVMPRGGVSLPSVCADAPDGTLFRVTLGRLEVTSGQCSSDPPPYDGVAYSDSLVGLGTVRHQAGRTVTARIRLTRVDGSAVTDDTRVTLGLGVYGHGPVGGRVGSTPVPGEVEEQGHRWRLREIASSKAGESALAIGLRATTTPLLVQTVTSAPQEGLTRTLLGGRVVATTGGGPDAPGSRQTVGLLVDQSLVAQVRVTRAGPATRLGLVTYEQAD